MTDPSVVTQFTGAMGIVWVIQELKKSGWFPHLTMNTAQLNRVASALGALAAGAAIHWHWDSATATLTLSGLTASAIATFLWGAMQQFVGQEMIYQLAYAPKAVQASALNAQADIAEVATDKVVHAIETKKD